MSSNGSASADSPADPSGGGFGSPGVGPGFRWVRRFRSLRDRRVSRRAVLAISHLALDALDVLAQRMAENIEIQDTRVGCPDRGIAPATHERLLGYAE
jgi:hypothetical protein